MSEKQYNQEGRALQPAADRAVAVPAEPEVSALRASIPSAGDWHYCGADRGGCSCMGIMFHDYPICKVTSGDWGDDYPSIRLVGDSSFDLKAEAYMEQITYGSIGEEQAKLNAYLIQAAPDLFHACSAAFEFLGGVDDAAHLRDTLMAALNKAQAIEARRAETQSGSVHESAVHEVDAPNLSNSMTDTPNDHR